MTNTANTEREWGPDQIRDFVKSAKSSVGRDGWALLVPALQAAVIRSEAMAVVMRQTAPVSPAAVALLVGDMLTAAGVEH
jgi:hypothetical protein